MKYYYSKHTYEYAGTKAPISDSFSFATIEPPATLDDESAFYNEALEKWEIKNSRVDKIELEKEALIAESKSILADLKDAKEDLENGEMLEDEQTISEANERIATIESRIAEIKIALKELNRKHQSA